MIDLFCGAGGTSTGAAKSGVCQVIAAINHDPVAIASHEANHEGVLHMTEDILIADTAPIVSAIEYWKKENPTAKVILWASLECTNFSKAKGGLPRNADSRTLAHGLFRYITAISPDYILIENVREFMAWGDLDANGKPVSKTNGREYIRWIKSVQSFGYEHDHRMLCAADFGGVTIRERYFGAFWKPGTAFAWPQPTHAKSPQKGNMFSDDRLPWRAVAEVLDFDELGGSIFQKRKPLVDKTINRILSGLKKFHNEPSIMVCNSPGYCTDIKLPAPTLTTVNSKALVTPMLMGYYTRPSAIRKVSDPAPTIACQQRQALVTPMLVSYYGASNGMGSVTSPAPTVTTKDRFAMVTPIRWIDRQFRRGYHSSVNEPVGSILTVPKTCLCTAFLVPTNFDNTARSIEKPAPTILASRKHISLCTCWIVNPQFNNSGNSIHTPAPTVIAQQKSRPLALATAQPGKSIHWDVQPTDTPAMIALRGFMRENGIADIFMRMLSTLELKRIQGFPDNYVLKGNTTTKKKHIGNSVETGVVKCWLRAIAQSTIHHN
jgi:DNA (cytosine-5)-methyltransferase 1